MVKKSARKNPGLNPLWYALAVLLLLQVVTICYVAKIKSDYNKDSRNSLTSLIDAAESKRYIEPILSVSENKAYIPEARVSTPLNDVSRRMRYDARTTQDGTVTDIYLSLPGVIGNQIDEDVATCDKMVRVSTSNIPHEDEKLVGEITPTASGLRYIFKHNQCQIYPTGWSDELVNVAESLQQY